MELLERYLQAVKKFLPAQRQDDIVAELRANMESELEDAEAERGRPLTQAEAEEWLKKFGPPAMVAARYMPQRSLIGPGIFPIYLYVLRMATIWACLVYVVVLGVVVPLVSPQTRPFDPVHAILNLPAVLFYTAAWVTLVFAGLEFFGGRYPEKCPPFAGLMGGWSPAGLPPLEKQALKGTKQPNLVHVVAEVIFGFLLLAWLLLIPHYPVLVLGPGVFILKTSPYVLSPVWWTFYWWMVGLNAVQLLWKLVSLLRGTWRNRYSSQHLVVKALGIVPIALMLSVPGSAYLLLRQNAPDAAHYGSMLGKINGSIHQGLAVVCAIAIAQWLWDVYQVTRRWNELKNAAH